MNQEEIEDVVQMICRNLVSDSMAYGGLLLALLQFVMKYCLNERGESFERFAQTFQKWLWSPHATLWPHMISTKKRHCRRLLRKNSADFIRVA